ncbi:hypothetical protein BH20GEM3_BH20GEM3_06160 [soil metagenome]
MIHTDVSPTESRSRGRPARPLTAGKASELLAEAAAILASSLDYQTTLQSVAELTAERLACYCLVDVAEQDGEPRLLATAHAAPRQARLLAETAQRYPPDLRQDSPFLEVLGQGEAKQITVTDEWLRTITNGDRAYLRLMRRLAPRQYILIPLIARGHTLGSLWLASTYSDRPFDDTEFTLARDLGRLAALHIDNARLYDQAKRAIALRDEVLGVVAHDLRNPVGTVRMATDLLLDPNTRGSGAALERHLGIIRRQADRMERLIRDLLDVTRIEAGRLAVAAAEPTPTGELIRDAVDALSPLVIEAGLHLAVQTGDDLPRVQADRERVAQVFSNLVGNAIKFTPAGGTLTLRAEPRESAVRFAVADTGPGIAADQVRHIFDRFWQAGHADGRGAGLGLAIVKGIVEAHGGEIEVESEPGHGTSFFFTLPRVQR